MKYLGYKRTPTSAKLRVQMTNGSRWDIPVQLIADSRDEFYSVNTVDQEDTVGFIKSNRLRRNAIVDWASNNMNWSDVESYAVKVADTIPDFDEGWANGAKSIIGEI